MQVPTSDPGISDQDLIYFFNMKTHDDHLGDTGEHIRLNNDKEDL